MKNVNIFIYAFVALIFFSSQQAKSKVLESDSLALIALYNNCGGSTWTGFESWLSGPLNTWKDVTVGDVDGTMRVKSVALTNMKLTGQLPSELGNLTGWSGRFDIYNQTELTGAFPAFLWNLTRVERMQIKFCGFTSIDTTGIHKMVNLYEFNTQGTPFEGEVPMSIFTLPKMKDIYLEDGKWSSLPQGIVFPTPTPIRRFYINGNNFDSLPDLTGIVFASGTKIKLYGNNFTFEDLEPLMAWKANANVSAFEYSPQRVVGTPMTHYLKPGETLTLTSNVGGTGNLYTWLKGEDVVKEDANYSITSFDPATQSGVYYCVAQNATVTGLDIMTAEQTVALLPIMQDSLALVALYNNCGGSTWTGFESWLSGPLNTWKDVSVGDVAGVKRVTSVALTNMKLTGELPSELGSLTGWTGRFDIYNQTELTGAFPAFLWNLTRVERMQIKFCGFTSIDTTGIHKMVNLYEFNTQGTPFEGEVPMSIFTLPKMKDIYLEDGKWSSLPQGIVFPTPTPIRRFYINGNNFDSLPDLTGIVFASGTKIKLYGNNFTFEDLEPLMAWKANANVSAFEYSPQSLIAPKQTFNVSAGSPVSMAVNVGGSANVYTWLKAGVVIEGAENATFSIAAAQKADAGSYVCVVQSTLVPGLDLKSDTFRVVVDGYNKINENSFGELKILGNPVKSELGINASVTIESWAVYTLTGKIVSEGIVNKDVFDISFENFKSGVYIVSLRANGTIKTLKVVKE